MFSRRTIAVKGFLGIALCLLVFAGVQVATAKKRQASNNTVIAKTAAAVTIKPDGVRVPLESVRKNQSLSARIARVRAGKTLYLVLKDVETNKQPGELYHVYLNLEEGKKPAPEAAIGTLNFFNFERKPSADSFFSFNVTEVLKRLAADRQLSEPLTITILPAGTPEEGAIPTIGQIELVEQ
jgi:hypothetical protein